MEQAIAQMAVSFWETLSAMAPYLLLGFLAAGILSVLVSPETVERHLGSGGFVSVAKAGIFGVPLPLCSCGVIPVAASLRRHGASRGATASFLLSTPQTGADSILVTLSLLGPVFAVFRPVAALLTGLLGGLLVSLVAGKKAGEPAPSETVCTDACCNFAPGDGRLRRIFSYAFSTLPADIGRSLLVGIAVAAVLAVVVPDDFFAGRLGHGITGMLVMMLCGIPVYVCATASVPVAAVLILEKGVSPGAALVFLMTGPATNAATIATIWRTMGAATAGTYLFSVGAAALGSGLALEALFAYPAIPQASGVAELLPGWVKYPAAVALLVVLAVSMLRRGASSPEEGPEGADWRLSISGMTCSHCAESVERALRACPGVESVSVDLGAGRALVTGPAADPEVMRSAVGEAGYSVSEISRDENTGREAGGAETEGTRRFSGSEDERS